jgi:hypothetical protein
MQTTDITFPRTVPQWQRSPSIIRVVRPRRSARLKMSGAALYTPPAKWTALAAFVLAVALHLAPVAIMEMKLDATRVEVAHAIDDNSILKAVD